MMKSHPSEGDVPGDGIDYRPFGSLYQAWARALSFTIASTLACLILLLPQLIAADSQQLDQRLLSLSMWGICAGFVHGVGYVPQLLVWRWTLGPWVGWPLMAISLFWWLG